MPEPAFNQRANIVLRPTRRGRHAGLSPEAEEHFLTLLRAGQHRSTAAMMCGLSPDTVDGWLKRGRGHDPRRPPRPEDVAFVRVVEMAEAQAEGIVTGNLVVLSRTNVRAGLEWLAAHSRERWGKRARPTQTPGAEALSRTSVATKDRVVMIDRQVFEDALAGRIPKQDPTRRSLVDPSLREEY